MGFGYGQKMAPEQEAERRRYATRTESWTATQTVRLKITETELLAAICRGWLPEQIERVSSRYRLESLPPALPDVPAFVDYRIAQAVATGDTAIGAAMKRMRAA